ncbi:putative signal transducing protein [Albibacterium profundi]|uniref:DUF2007 domain-containing protein n=1 Tax=Albibacterium profundi TaxID=3134906 RepID=A0ABV5CCX2_9SPHI
MEKDWKKIYTGTNFYKVELIRQVLEDREISAVVMNKQDSSYKFGQIELYVHERDEEGAKAIIEEMSEIED